MIIYLKAGVIFISLASLLTFGWGTYLQIKDQAETNKEMRQVADHIKSANALTAVTVERMKPLAETAATLRKMNEGLQTTAQLLTEMNVGLTSVTKSEQAIVTNITGLNQSITLTHAGLTQVKQQNGKLVTFTTGLNKQALTEYGSMHRINGLTDTSIAQMQKLNKKFSILKLLP